MIYINSYFLNLNSYSRMQQRIFFCDQFYMFGVLYSTSNCE